MLLPPKKSNTVIHMMIISYCFFSHFNIYKYYKGFINYRHDRSILICKCFDTSIKDDQTVGEVINMKAFLKYIFRITFDKMIW